MARKRLVWNRTGQGTFFRTALRPGRASADPPFMMLASTRRGMRKATILIVLGLLGSLVAMAQKARPGLDAPATRPSLPNTTPDVTPSRAIGPFDAKQAQEGRAAGEVLCDPSEK